MKNRWGRVAVVAAISVSAWGAGTAVAHAAVETTAKAGITCDDRPSGLIKATGLQPGSDVHAEYEGRTATSSPASASGTAQFAISYQPGELQVGDTVPYSVVSDGQTVASGSFEVEELCGTTGSFTVTRDCATPNSMTVAVELSGAPAGETLDLLLYGDGFFFTEPGHKGNPGFNGEFTAGEDGSYSGTVEVSPDVSYIAAEPVAFTADFFLGAVDYNHAGLLAGTVPVPACSVTPPPGDGGTPPGDGGTPPGDGGTPPGDGGTPPGDGGTPPAAEPTVVSDGAAQDTVQPGGQQTVTVAGFQPGESVQVTLYSTPVDLGVHQADPNGVVSVTFTVPAGLELGSHRVELVGGTSGRVFSVPFQVAAPKSAVVPAASSGTLAYTGVDVVPILSLGVLALAAGTVLTLAGTRRTARR
jgi:hypothetical protein